MTGLLVIMGSGETAPTMVKPHRAIFERVDGGPALLIDTPYGFQENADEISARAVRYFADSTGRRIEVLGWRVPPESPVERERALTGLHDAGWVFAGPGSPTYALRQWRDTPVPDALVSVLERDGVVVFASAAALTLGSHAIPVYEIYKAGIEPHWVPGLDLVARLTGLPVVVIPHYDNTEGGHHDTRFCYVGERRLSRLERDLPAESFILGVDEHTAVLLDLGAGTASVLGNGCLTIRRQGNSVTYPTGAVVPLATLGSLAPGTAAPVVAAAPVDATPASSLLAEAETAEARFDDALARRDVDGCVAAILDLDQARTSWSADTDVSDEGERAAAALRRMVVRLGELAMAGARDPREVLDPYLGTILELRRRARESRDFATSNWIRDRLTATGVEVRDTPEGASWSLPA
jgi:cyanophycinase-like exopeptidase